MIKGQRAGESAIAVDVEQGESYYWCSCGKSSKQPFCDGSHNKQIMTNIEVSKIIDPIPASDGAGVKLKRSIGVEPNYFDPFLMLDEFGSENSEDYIAGFPPHPHRGIETVTYMLAGDFEHKDSTGGEGKMTAGDVQWMKTGS